MLLRTFGGLSIQADAGDGPVPSLGPRRLALLALVAAAGPHGITRERILGILWPEADEDQARHTLSQNLYVLRRESGHDWITGTAQLRLADSIRSDVREFQDALSRERLAEAAALYAGPFLEGFYLPGTPEFERWVEEVRARLHFAALKVLENLARRAMEAGAHGEAIDWGRRLCELDPFSATYAAGLTRALVANGNHGGALRVAREYESRVRRELDAEPDPVIGELIAQLQAARTPAETPRSPAPQPIQPATAVPLTAPAGAAPTASKRKLWLAAAVVATLITAAIAWRIGGPEPAQSDAAPFLAIGAIQARDTAVLGPVLRDMLATNLARIQGIQVVANSRLIELLPEDAEPTPAEAADAARRAGANEIVEGELGVNAGSLVLNLRRVALNSGVVRQGYTVRALNAYALTDSATAAIAQDLHLEPPVGAVAAVRTSSAIAYAIYEQGLRDFFKGDAPAANRLMNAALERDSTFAMAAYYNWLSNLLMQRHDDASRALALAEKLAARTTERERLLIQGRVAFEQFAPASEYLAIARELTARFPNDPDAEIFLGESYMRAGDYKASIGAFNRAIAIDSAVGVTSGAFCRLCSAIFSIGDAYLWWDSAAASVRTGQRLLRFSEADGWSRMVEGLLRLGRRADAEAAVARSRKLNPIPQDFEFFLNRDLIRWGRLEELEAALVSELRIAGPEQRGERPWLLTFVLRNQGRLREAQRLARAGVVPQTNIRIAADPGGTADALISFERGRARESADRFLRRAALTKAGGGPPGVKARHTAWNLTLAATALAAAGDTAAVQALADSVQRIGARSGYARDPKLHYFLRGLLLQKQNRHAEAVAAFRRALFSPTDGYTRVNLEMAKSLMVLRRYREAIAILRPALRGGIDGSNTYVTHTELHWTIAKAFEASAQRDSAAAHFAFVERAWRRADPEFTERYREARAKATPSSERS